MAKNKDIWTWKNGIVGIGTLAILFLFGGVITLVVILILLSSGWYFDKNNSLRK